MKFVKRISLFFIYPLTMFSIGFVSNMAILEYFYPGEKKQQPSSGYSDSQEILIETAQHEEPVVTADTRYIVEICDVTTGDVSEEEAPAPDKFMGLTREKLAEEVGVYNKNPSLADQKQGFVYMELVSFSPERIVMRKSYETDQGEEEKGFFLLNENHYVVVYDHSLSRVYMNTGILVEGLPEKLQEEVLHMKYVEDERELYNFLESYSS